MSFEWKSGDGKAKIQQDNLIILFQLLNATRPLETWTKNSRRVRGGTVL